MSHYSKEQYASIPEGKQLTGPIGKSIQRTKIILRHYPPAEASYHIYIYMSCEKGSFAKQYVELHSGSTARDKIAVTPAIM